MKKEKSWILAEETERHRDRETGPALTAGITGAQDIDQKFCWGHLASRDHLS